MWFPVDFVYRTCVCGFCSCCWCCCFLFYLLPPAPHLIPLKHFFLDFSCFQKFFPIVFYSMKCFNQLVFGDFSTANWVPVCTPLHIQTIRLSWPGKATTSKHPPSCKHHFYSKKRFFFIQNFKIWVYSSLLGRARQWFVNNVFSR